MTENKRVTIFAGHYGSGKTNIAINYALYLAKKGLKVDIADLDIVNPYFRTKDSEKVLSQNGIRLISSEYANSNVDTPALPPEAYTIIHNKEIYGVIDVGGDDRGALALGRYMPSILEEDNYEFLFVINKFRPLTATCEDTIEVMKEIEYAINAKFTGIVNNSNLGDETTIKMVEESFEYAKKVSELAGIPIKMTTVKSSVWQNKESSENIFPIELYVKQSWSH